MVKSKPHHLSLGRSISKMTSQQVGYAAEQTALEFLQSKGMTLVCRNFSCKMGEIDLIMLDDRAIVFVEVRLRHDSRYGSGAETVTYQKMRKIIKTAQYYLINNPPVGNLDYRFDVISMDSRIDWIKNAFTLDG